MAVSLLCCSVLLSVSPLFVTGLSSEKFVVQPHPIQFNEEPHDWTVTEGASVSLTCNTTVVQVIGYIDENTTPSPQIKWFHNNIMINSSGHFTINNYGIDTSILTIRNVMSLEQGEYYCVVNEWVKPDGDWWAKTRSKSGYITVMDETSLVVNSGEYVTLCCKDSTAEPLSSGVVWMKDGVEISYSVRAFCAMCSSICKLVVQQVINRNGGLLLYNISKENSGRYQCIDPADNTTLLVYHVTVNANNNSTEKPQLLTESKYVENYFIKIRSDADIHGCIDSPLNQSVTLNCNISGHTTISWYKNGELLDINSEGTTFNQTTGGLIIRREDACELLGVYQCFASNEIDTVHVSTRVLPFGWPNLPGRPELVSYIAHTNGFRLKVKLHNPDYLGGLDEDDILYDVYMNDAVGYSDAPQYINTFNSSLDTVDIDLTSKVRIIGVQSLSNTYYLTVQLVIRDKDLAGIIALPTGSPMLVINVLCDLVDHPPAIIEQTCNYDASDMMVTHNISWRVMGSTLNYVNADHIYIWEFGVNCYYPNGTLSIQPIRYYITSNKYYLQAPKDSYCVVSVAYDTSCGPATASSLTLPPCNNYTTDHDNNNNNATEAHPPSTKTDANNTDLSIELFILLGVVSLMLIIIIAIAIYMCCTRFRQKKERNAGKNLAYVVVQ